MADPRGGKPVVTIAVMIVVALTAALLLHKLYRSERSYRAAGAADVGADAAAHHSYGQAR